MKVLVDVTQEDIEQGQRKSPYGCMVHRAFDRATEGAFSEMYCTQGEIVIQIGVLQAAVLPYPANVARKVKRWDLGARTRPFAFEVDVSTPVIVGR